MGYNKIIIAFFLALVPFLTKAQTDDWPRFELYQLVQGQDSGIFVITDADSNLIFAPFMRFRFDPDTALIINNDTVAYRFKFQEGLGISIEYDSETNTYLFQSLSIEDTVYNGTASLIPKGTPLYAAGVQGNYWSVAPADAGDANKMPVVIIAGEDIGAGEEGIGLIKGHIRQVNTTGLASGAEVYVAVGGGYTATKPKGENAIVQRLGTVIKGNSTNGSGIINLGDPRTTSNLNPDKIFIGGADSTVTTINLKTFISDSLSNYVRKTVLNDTLLNYTSKQLLTDSLSKYLLTVNYFRDSTRLFQDSILNHYQNATLVKSDTIRLPIGGAATPSYWDSVGTGNLVNTNTGNVGINQSSPAYRLDVNGTGNIQEQFRAGSGYFRASNGIVSVGASDATLPFEVGGEVRLRSNVYLASPDGKVLIDTTFGTTGQPNYKLEVNGDVNLIGSGTAYRINGVAIGGGNLIINDNATARVLTATGISDTIDAEINLTYSPENSILRVGGSTANSSLQLFNSTTGAIQGNDGLQLIIDGLNAELKNFENGSISFLTNSISRMKIESDGDVGIGVSSTTYKLEVNGNVKVDSLFYNGLQQLSDKSIKTNIKPIKNQLENITKLNPVSFEFNDKIKSRKGQKGIGLIAQELEKVYPNLVSTSREDFKSVSYIDLIPYLISAIQEQQAQIEELKSEVKQLKKKVKQN